MIFKRLILFLSKRPALNLALAFAYYLLVVLPHEQVGKFCAWLFDDHMTRDDYNLVILLAGIAGLAAYLALIFNNSRKEPGLRPLLAVYLAATVIFAAVCYKLLVVINIEFIHFVQYAMMAVLLFPLVKKYGETICWITLLGALDEAWQYFYLAPQRTNYYDFNDVIINLVGGGFGLILVRSLSLDLKPDRSGGFFRSPVFIAYCLLGLFIFAAFKMDGLKMGPPAPGEPSLWTLIRVPQIGFWTVVHPNVTFHAVQPLEGLVIVALLLLFYAGLGGRFSGSSIKI